MQQSPVRGLLLAIIALQSRGGDCNEASRG